MKMEEMKTDMRSQILEAVREYHRARHKAKSTTFKVGDKIPYAGRVYDEKEMVSLVDSALDFWLTTGRFAEKFETEFAQFLGVRHCSLVNSGSSANLLAFMALTSSKLGEKRIRPGDEVITVAAGFPTTVAPIIQYGAVPVFVDVSFPSYNIDVSQLDAALSPKTKAVMAAHTLGNPFDLAAVKAFCDKHGLWLIEDNCDSLGSRYCLDGKWQYTGTIGDIGTSSFYPPHHMSCSKNTIIPYLDENGIWHTDKIEDIYQKYGKVPERIKIISFDKNNTVHWTAPCSVLRHKLGKKRMVKITSQHGREVEVTEDHSVFKLDRESAKIVAVSARDLEEDDYLVATNSIPYGKIVHDLDFLPYFLKEDSYVSNFNQENLRYVKNPDYRWQFKKRNALPMRYLKKYDLEKDPLEVGISQSKKIPARIQVDERFCRLIGYFLAEGSYQNGLVFSFHRKERDLSSDVVDISKGLFGIAPRIRKAGANGVSVEIESKNVELIFRNCLGIASGAKAKRVPWLLYHCSENLILSFVYAFTRGDGSFQSREWNTNLIDVTSVSKDLLNDFQYLLSMIGISASLYRRNAAGKKRFLSKESFAGDNFSLAFGGYAYGNKTIIKTNSRNRNNFACQIPLLPVFRKYISIGKNQKTISRTRLAKYLPEGHETNLLVGGGLSYLKIRKIEFFKSDENDWVYDFSVPENENFYGGFLGLFMHNTMGEGGAVYTNDTTLKRIVESFRDWGRDCWCPSGKDDTCHRRFKWKLGDLPEGYDHKYIYSHFGYNLKATDMQAAVGCAQLKKLPGFIKARKKNWTVLREGLEELKDAFILPEPTPHSDPSWFGFLLTVKEKAGFTRSDIVSQLESKGIQTRMLFAGNLLRHPCFDEMRKENKGFRVVGSLANTDVVMNRTFWIGVYPGMKDGMLDTMISEIKNVAKVCPI